MTKEYIYGYITQFDIKKAPLLQITRKMWDVNTLHIKNNSIKIDLKLNKLDYYVSDDEMVFEKEHLLFKAFNGKYIYIFKAQDKEVIEGSFYVVYKGKVLVDYDLLYGFVKGGDN